MQKRAVSDGLAGVAVVADKGLGHPVHQRVKQLVVADLQDPESVVLPEPVRAVETAQRRRRAGADVARLVHRDFARNQG